MRFLMIICETGLDQEVVEALDAVHVPGYTKFSGVSGVGETGRREGTPIWPGQNTILLVGLPDNLVPPLMERLQPLRAGYRGQLRAIKVFAFPVEELI